MPAELYAASGGANRKLREVYAASGGANRYKKEVWAQSGGANRKIFQSGIGYTTQTWSENVGDWITSNSVINADGSGRMSMQITNVASGRARCYLRFIFDTPVSLPISGLNTHFAMTASGSTSGVATGDHEVSVTEINAHPSGFFPKENYDADYSFTFNRPPGPVSQVTLHVTVKGRTQTSGNWADFVFRWTSGGIKLFGYPITAPSGILPIQQ